METIDQNDDIESEIGNLNKTVTGLQEKFSDDKANTKQQGGDDR